MTNIFLFLKDRNAANPALSHKWHVLDYSCRCWAECLAGSSSYANCGFYSFFPLSSSFAFLSFFRPRSVTLFPPTLNRYFTVNTSTLSWPEAMCFWARPGFHLFVMLMKTEIYLDGISHWWNYSWGSQGEAAWETWADVESFVHWCRAVSADLCCLQLLWSCGKSSCDTHMWNTAH